MVFNNNINNRVYNKIIEWNRAKFAAETSKYSVPKGSILRPLLFTIGIYKWYI